MRTPKYLSPTSFMLYEKDRDEYYQRYMSPAPLAKQVQTVEMAIGSAFDFSVKQKICTDLKQELPKGLKLQVDNPLVAEEALAEGKLVLDLYVQSGAYAALLIESAGSRMDMEFSVAGILHSACGAVPLSGRPDAVFKGCIMDWKVNSWRRGCSPAPGYVGIYDRSGPCPRRSRGDCVPVMVGGVICNLGAGFKPDWEIQIGIYSMIIGQDLLGDGRVIAAVDQIVGPGSAGRIAKHRAVIPVARIENLKERLFKAWEHISGKVPFWDELSFEDCAARMRMLDKAATVLKDKIFR